MSTIDTSTWNPDADLNVEIEGIPLNADAGIAQTWQALRVLMAAVKGDGDAIKSMIDVMQGATASADGASGLVPKPEAGDHDKVLKGDGTWGTVTASEAESVPWSGVTGKPSTFTPSSHTHGGIANDGKLGTASRAVVTDSGGAISVSSVTSTELGCLSGVTSAIQTQLNGKFGSGDTVPIASGGTGHGEQLVQTTASDFNSYTVSGDYHVGFPSGTANAPVASSGKLDCVLIVRSIEPSADVTPNSRYTQIAIVQNPTTAIRAQIFVRKGYSTGGWTAWSEVAFTDSDIKLGTSSRAVMTDASGVVAASSVTAAELGYLSGVTSAVQTQLNAKAADSDVVHLAGSEVVSGEKQFQSTVRMTVKDLGFKCEWGSYSMAFKIGSGGTNRGIWDYNLNKWVVYSDASNCYFNGTVNQGSDERLKTKVQNINDDVLDAWSEVGWVEFKYKSENKAEGVHAGLVAQRIIEVFARHGINAEDYQIVARERHEDGSDGYWMVRYIEAFAMEAACQRRRADALERRIAILEAKLSKEE